MQIGTQLDFDDTLLPQCPFVDLLEQHDTQCRKNFHNYKGYDVLSCDDERLPNWWEEVRGPGFMDVTGITPSGLYLPSFVPVLRSGSAKVVRSYPLPYAAASLEDLWRNKPSKGRNLHQWLGVPQETKLILLGFAHDRIIEEKIWPNRSAFFHWLADLGFDLITSVDYSIWDDQPHAERFINAKRDLLTFEEMSHLGIPAIPHIYWYGRKDITRLALWLNKNHGIASVSINLQTMHKQTVWNKALGDIQQLISELSRPIHFLVNGPSTIKRMDEIIRIIPSVTILGGKLSRMATIGQEMNKEGIYQLQSDKTTSERFADSMQMVTQYISLGINER
jgi:hypothetical protein